MYRNVLFDLYGTLIDIHTDEKKRYLWQNMSEFFRAYGAYYTPASLKHAYLTYVSQLEAQLGGPYPEIQLELVFLQLYLDKGIHADSALIQHTGTMFRTVSREQQFHKSRVGFAAACVRRIQNAVEERQKSGHLHFLLRRHSVFFGRRLPQTRPDFYGTAAHDIRTG